ncbi:MAG: tellurite resistance/C4-dicarboxylate transporter family protein [Candidatus Dormibacteria bacterium]
MEFPSVRLPAATGAMVMATGIVAYGARLLRWDPVADAWLALAGAIWICLVVSVPLRLAGDRMGLGAEMRSPVSLSWVAATAVLGVNALALHLDAVGSGLAALAAALLLGVAHPVLASWARPTEGTSFLLTVALEGVGGVLAELAAATRWSGLLYAGVALWLLGLCAYVFVVRDFDWRQLHAGRGDHWVAGGALAIATLVAGDLYRVRWVAGGQLRPGDPLVLAVLLPWCACSLLMALLVGAELRRPRWHFHGLRWATVFPVGMYGACTLGLGQALGARALHDLGAAWVALGLVSWVLVAVAALASLRASDLEVEGAGSGPS